MVFKNDTDLIRSLKKGEPKAYTFLVDSYHHKLCIYTYGLTNDHDLSEDIVQNVFVYIWKNRLKLKDHFLVKNYLYRSVYNEFIDQYRKRKTVMTIEKKYIDALNHIVEKEDENSLEKLIALVKKEIGNLPPKCKQTFLLSKQEGLTNIEIAEYLNVSIKSVEAHITKAFSILRKTLGGKMNSILFLLFGINKNLKI
ncbi:RNA polymerase sigma factor [Flavivirga spongiicola]|uniref:Sigma-70 family RNA polymerase sigma factor n=1 Tax=Flavivirga spongiicola TaxID=421621 RepID=A0ABU7XR39_9FLAO|nr:sigma-70 family RNA polymerase sigma factor [Flavivirga sp. MEBiC05379]MDO5978233.1 sigma-70 family RNA polymerase sigma factor [Flavivirga sp. MEBiC05379]